ncbi:MAG: response regulator [Myxococcota bacterium]|jgi:two-component system alkaline phosphatase synthesis response regulator PhoP|nr:response regulator [Myxococcota bacterium]
MKRTITLLFVDDDREFLLGKRLFFEARGFTVLTAESSEEGLALLETQVPDLIFVDLMIEHYDSGFALSHRIRQDERLRQVPVVMLSGVASATGRRFDDKEALLQRWSGLDAFLDKPVSGKQLLQLVQEKLGLALEDDESATAHQG